MGFVHTNKGVAMHLQSGETDEGEIITKQFDLQYSFLAIVGEYELNSVHKSVYRLYRNIVPTITIQVTVNLLILRDKQIRERLR